MYAKERALINDVKEELRQGRRCQIYATYTGEKDVTRRIEEVLRQEGIRAAVMRSSVPTDKREDWYEKQLKAGVEVVICHPKLVETGLDLLAFPTLHFFETGYSLHTLRQASRRSWRIGQRLPVRVKFVTYSGTMQETCLRLMGKKMLVALMMEGKFSGEGLQALYTDEDLLSAMARELVEKAGIGESADAVWRELGGQGDRVLPRNQELVSEPESEPVRVLETGDQAPSAALPSTFGCRCSNQVRHRGNGGGHPSGRQPRMLLSSSLSSIELGETSCRLLAAMASALVIPRSENGWPRSGWPPPFLYSDSGESALFSG